MEVKEIGGGEKRGSTNMPKIDLEPGQERA